MHHLVLRFMGVREQDFPLLRDKKLWDIQFFKKY